MQVVPAADNVPAIIFSLLCQFKDLPELPVFASTTWQPASRKPQAACCCAEILA
jgi:hypothetical protein